MALPIVGGLFAGSLGAFFAAAIGGIVARILWSLGLGVVSYIGVTALMNQLVTLVHNQIGGITSDVLHLIGMAGFDVFLSLCLSAHIGTVSFMMASSGFKRLQFMNTEGQ